MLLPWLLGEHVAQHLNRVCERIRDSHARISMHSHTIKRPHCRIFVCPSKLPSNSSVSSYLVVFNKIFVILLWRKWWLKFCGNDTAVHVVVCFLTAWGCEGDRLMLRVPGVPLFSASVPGTFIWRNTLDTIFGRIQNVTNSFEQCKYHPFENGLIKNSVSLPKIMSV